MKFDDGGWGIPPSIPPLATVGFQCYACGWAQRYALTAADLSANLGVNLWVRCKKCNGFAFLTGVESEGPVPKGILSAGCEIGAGFYGPVGSLHEQEAEMWSTLGIKWEDA